MKYVKMLGLAAIAAAALMAFLGAGTASATVLCKNTPAANTDCSEPYGAGTVLDSSVEDTAKLSSFGITLDTCSEGTVKGTIGNGTEAGDTTHTVKGSISELTWGSCTVTTTTTTAGTLEAHHIAGTDNATVTSNGAVVTVNFAGSDCEFGTTNTDIGTLTGGNPATFDINGTIPEVSGRSGCPASGGWSGHYKATEPSGTLDVAAG